MTPGPSPVEGSLVEASTVGPFSGKITRNGSVFKAGKFPLLFCHFMGFIFIFTLGTPTLALSSEEFPARPAELTIKDRLSFQLVTGSLFSTKIFNGHEHTLDYWQTNLRLGCALNQPGPTNSIFRGNFEALLEVTGSYIYEGPGDYMAGITALLRYNFVQPDSRFFPYVQAGAGIVFNDIYKDPSQDAVGQAIEFTPQASLGFHYLFHPKWSLNAEVMFHHISNANLSNRNDGINSLGGFLGVTYFFNPRR